MFHHWRKHSSLKYCALKRRILIRFLSSLLLKVKEKWWRNKVRGGKCQESRRSPYERHFVKTMMIIAMYLPFISCIFRNRRKARFSWNRNLSNRAINLFRKYRVHQPRILENFSEANMLQKFIPSIYVFFSITYHMLDPRVIPFSFASRKRIMLTIHFILQIETLELDF